MKTMKQFDLNIEKVLEDWGIHHALREVIANALDEQALSKTKDIAIYKDKEGWHIRDYGRGLKYNHLTQNEDKEKHANPERVIGKFGVGLKDALATFDRKKIGVRITSRYGHITLGKAAKHGFESITTLHALIDESADPKFVGTEFVFRNIKDDDVRLAKEFFLKFSDERLLENTQFGQVLEKGKAKHARIYIGGLRVAEEENFLFSYNITAVNAAIRKALNRERTNVGRTAYTDRVKAILLGCTSKDVARLLVDDLKNFDAGTTHDEMNWTDVQVHSCRQLNATGKVIFLTPTQMFTAKEMVDRARKDGYTVVAVPESVREKIKGLKDLKGGAMRDLDEYTRVWNTSFEFSFITEKEMTKKELEVFRKTNAILKLIGGKPRTVRAIRISETMRLESFGYHEAAGVYEPMNELIVIKRTQLESLKSYAGTLLHEAAHALSGAGDISSEFEAALTALLGTISSKAV
jgi:hypothetical protein